MPPKPKKPAPAPAPSQTYVEDKTPRRRYVKPKKKFKMKEFYKWLSEQNAQETDWKTIINLCKRKDSKKHYIRQSIEAYQQYMEDLNE